MKRKGSLSTADGRQYGKKRRKNQDGIVLPTKFLLGGNIHDPLNLASLSDGRNQVTPQSSPLPTPKHKKEVEVLIPANINDPLNLNNNDDIEGVQLISPCKGKARKKRKRNRTDSETTVDDDQEHAKSGIEGECAGAGSCPTISPTKALRLQSDVIESAQAKLDSKIVSPAIPQGSNYQRQRKNTITEKPKVNKDQPSNSENVKKKKNKKPAPKRYRPQDERFKYGNYNRYYGYRNQNNDYDIRLNKMKKEWFAGKDVLDLGCNTGHLTLAVAKDFSPNLVLGVDIDDSLIQIARKNTRYYVMSGVPNNDHFPSSLQLCHGPLAPLGLPASESINNDKQAFPQNVVFISGNYVLEKDEQLGEQVEEYDCILCLSLTKWIHLNWGDDALKRTFKRIFGQLRPGGRLVLEAQPWCSYTKKHSITVIIHLFFLLAI